ncbi:DUF3822 family protein [bacterium]|nr:DUF3822 family protein [bacterium]
MTNKPYQLSIRLQSDGFSLSILDDGLSVLSTKKGKINLLKLNEAELVDEFKLLFESDIKYNTSELIIENELYTLVPQFFTGNDSYIDLMKFQHPDFDINTNIIFNKVSDNLKTNLIFGCPAKIIKAIKKVFDNIEISHSIVEFLESFENNNGVFVALGNTKIDVAVVSDSKLLLLNTFTYSSNEDILYHLLNIMYTLKLQPEMRQLSIFTQQNESDLQNLLVKHIPNTTIIQSKN